MKFSKMSYMLCLVLLFNSQTYALEQSASVKSSIILKTESSWNGKPIEYPSGKPEVTGMLIEIAPGGETGWHLHPVASFGFIIEGELEVELKNGAVKRFKAGDGLAEVVNTLHNGRNLSAAPLKLVVFYVGSVDETLSVEESAQ